MSIEVKLRKLGSSQITYHYFEDGSTINDLLEATDNKFIENGITVDGDPVEKDTILSDGDVVFIGKAMKGNLGTFEVAFARLGGKPVIHLEAEEGTSIKDILSQEEEIKSKFFRENGKPAYEFRIGGTELVNEDHVLTNSGGNIRIICSQKMKGNEVK